MKFLITFLTSALLCLGAGVDAWAAEHGTREEALALIDKTAAHLIDEGPEKTFFEVSNPKGRFTYRDLYIAIYDLHGKVMAHGALPRLVGVNIYDYRDDDDKYYIREILDRAAKGQQGPVDYKWIHPATRRMQVKSAYFRQVGLYVISAGTYR
ncbi:cache domain-containing protein [Pseudoduganella namucuonensis]|uniref:Cytochrome c n=1 Tax=Pseudoduganella namucuonensis TaxID=1035707 RepID=A0A1I7HSI9_9BURK|nr:cache domain-containing protein [Pseudoduganella namucuonensis]SFU63633.1 cytochrome c [Pseudoduganella namucuonensis]